MSAPAGESRTMEPTRRRAVISDEKIDAYKYVVDLYGHRWLIGACCLLGCLLAGAYLLFLAEPVFISTAKILPSGEKARSGGQLSGLAALAGISLPQESSNEALYDEILHSKDFLDTLLEVGWKSAKLPDRPARLAELWEMEADSSRPGGGAALREELLYALKGKIFFTQSPQTGVMQLDVLTSDPVLSYEINTFLLQRLDAYNRDVRKSKAGENRRFVAKNTDEARQSLQKAEEDLRRFREINRTVGTPTLQLELERRLQEVEINRNIYLELRKQYELAKIEEFKSANFISVLESPVVPVYKSAPRRKLVMALGAFFGLFAGILFAGLHVAWKTIKPADRPAPA